jgi:hypothetical protein
MRLPLSMGRRSSCFGHLKLNSMDRSDAEAKLLRYLEMPFPEQSSLRAAIFASSSILGRPRIGRLP